MRSGTLIGLALVVLGILALLYQSTIRSIRML
jgi:hypothetical protein